MKKIPLLLSSLLFTILLNGQEKITSHELNTAFNQFKKAANKEKKIWAKNLYGPLLIINPSTREVYANAKDSLGELILKDGIFVGQYPQNKLIANTHVKWNGTDWAMVMLPFPENKNNRIGLMAHERFHVVQQELGFFGNNQESHHLDKINGRIYLRLELEALKQAVKSTHKATTKEHLTNAMAFRNFRYQLFPGADRLENSLEMNEGLAEYTGEATSGRKIKEKATHFIQQIDSFYQQPSFVRSFAYQTTPIYGYLLDQQKKGWNRTIKADDNLTQLFNTAFKLPNQQPTQATVDSLTTFYNAEFIRTEEKEREKKRIERFAGYKKQFIEQPHFIIPLENMRIQFNTNNLFPLDDFGTVYPTMTVIDKWGQLTVNKGGLLDPSWKKITLTMPTKIDKNKVAGDGWEIDLKDGYSLHKTEEGNYKLSKE